MPMARPTQSPPSRPDAPYPVSECRWEEIENNSFKVEGLAHQAPVALSVVFSDESGNLFSTVRIILCCGRELHDKKWRDWSIRDMGSAVNTAEAVHRFDQPNSARMKVGNSTLPNDSSLPKCTIIFEMIDHQQSAHSPVWLGPTLRASHDPRLAQQSSVCILLDRELPLFPDTHSATLYFITHFTAACTLTDVPPKLQPIAHHFVEVLPIIAPWRQIPYKELPVEILLRIFRYVAETPKYSGWRRDLLSFALVCRQWTCSLDLLLWDLHTPPNNRLGVTRPPNIHVLAKVVTERPVLARSISHLSTQYFRGLVILFNDASTTLPAFTSSLITILGSARNLRTLELTHLDVSQMEALGNALCDLPVLHSFSTGQVAQYGVISIVQLAYCLASWPLLKSLTIHGLQPPAVTETQVALRPPACALTELHLEGVFMTDAELLYFTTPSFKTLESVTLDCINVSDGALQTFLEGVSENVSNLTLHNVGGKPGTQETALDATIVKMYRLKNLSVKGRVATELMVSRKANLFSTSRLNKGLTDGAPLPIIRLYFDHGLPITIADHEWPGWDIVKPYTGPRCGGVHRAYTLEQLRALNFRPEGYRRAILGHQSAGQSSEAT